MKEKTKWLILSCLMVVAILLASCAKTTPTTTTTAKTTTPTTTAQTTKTTTAVTTTVVPTTKPTTTATGKWWDKFGEPQYGGTITSSITVEYKWFDPMRGSTPPYMYFEHLGWYKWETGRDEWAFQTGFCPDQYRTGLLAESWEQPDMQTIIFHIRKGVYWQDKPPVNGRELTAEDIAYSYNRLYGIGGGFTKPTPYAAVTAYEELKSVTATDKYTAVFKMKKPSAIMWSTIMDINWGNFIIAREVVDKYGSYEDWRNAVGTGPFVLTDYTSSSSFTYTRNPNYWGYDGCYPKNRLPYVDTVKELVIPDIATTLAALRSGKIDVVRGINWTQAASIGKTDPEIMQNTAPSYGFSVEMRVANKPFTDIRVRTALQMAIDLNSIAKSYYGGTVDPTPCGLVSPVLKGYFTPYEKWPQKIKDEYAYNPAGAKKLLAEAGYPNGFKTNVVSITTSDVDLLQVIKSYFADIGVDMDIRLLDATSWTSYIRADKHDQMSASQTTGLSCGLQNPPDRILSRRYSTNTYNYGRVNDPVYDAMYDKFIASLDAEEQRKICIEANDYAIAKHWSVNILPQKVFNLYQPWFKGYAGEAMVYCGFLNARCWIDQDLRKSLVR